MQGELKRVINLAKITGSRIIVFNPDHPEEAYVVVDLDDYEELFKSGFDVRSLTEEELIDKINRDIALWKSENDFKNLDNIIDFQEDDDLDAISKRPITKIEDIILAKKKEVIKRWTIPVERWQGREEAEEEKQYLEEVVL